MRAALDAIADFLDRHHVLTLATMDSDGPQCSSLFYTFLKSSALFIVASDSKTEHMGNVLQNPKVAAAVALETSSVGKIEGLQVKGVMRVATAEERRCYFDAFPYALAMQPELWAIEAHHMKLTDNRLGFGKKLIWVRDGA